MSCSRKIHAFITDKRVEVKNGESILHTNNQIVLGTVPPGGTTNQVLTKCSNRDYHTHWEDITNLIGTIIPPTPTFSLVIKNVVFVSGAGDDTTGQPDRLDLPYATIAAAVNAASVGQSLVYVYTGTYSESISPGNTSYFTKDVNLYLEQGTNLSIDFTGGSLFDTSLGNHTNVIYGPGSNLTLIGNSPINAGNNLAIEVSNLTLEKYGFSVGGNNNTFKLIADNVTVANDLLTAYGSLKNPPWELRSECTRSPIVVNVNKLQQTGGGLTNHLFSFTYVIRPVILNLGHVCVGEIHPQASYFKMRKNVCVMTININTLLRNKTTPHYSSLFGVDSCLAVKNINVDWFFTTGLLWNAYEIVMTPYISNNYPETGIITVNGMFDINVSPNPLFHANYDGYFDFRQPASSLRFKLDIVNFTMASNITSTMNISTPHLKSKITVSGRIECAPTTSVTPNGVITMGFFDGQGHNAPTSSGIAMSTVVLRDLVIAVYDTTTSFSVYKNSGLSVAELPVINSYSTLTVDPSIVQRISTIVIDSFVA